MVDITESDIELTEDDFKIKDEIPFERAASMRLEKHWILSTSDEAKQIRDKILQNQKDAQEYRKPETMEAIKQYQNWALKGYVPISHLWLKELTKSESQHKKLVDAIQNRINKPTKISGHIHEYGMGFRKCKDCEQEKLESLIEKQVKIELQNLLGTLSESVKESEND